MVNANEKGAQTYVRALRLPFITASILPFIFGSVLIKGNFDPVNFLLGVICVVCVHLAANLINDYADSKTGADWQDNHFYKFFGGSKLIQEKVLPERFFLNAAIVCFILASLAIIILSLRMGNCLIIGLYLAIFFLAWSYSEKPLAFSYCRLGEIIIFLLFGPVPVMGGYFIQTGIFPTLEGFLCSVPFGLFTTAILFANEVPDFNTDKAVGKMTWVSLTGQKRAYIAYILLIASAFGSIFINIILGYLNLLVMFSFIFVFPAIKATKILKKYPSDKNRLMDSSKLSIAIQACVGIILILGVIL